MNNILYQKRQRRYTHYGAGYLTESTTPHTYDQKTIVNSSRTASSTSRISTENIQSCGQFTCLVRRPSKESVQKMSSQVDDDRSAHIQQNSTSTPNNRSPRVYKYPRILCLVMLLNFSPIFSGRLLVNSSKLSQTLHLFTEQYELFEYNIRGNGDIVASAHVSKSEYRHPYGAPAPRAASTRSKDRGLPLSELEKRLGLKRGLIHNTLKKYKKLVTKLVKTEPYSRFYAEVLPEWKRNLDKVRSILRQIISKKGGQLSDRNLDQMEEVIAQFRQLSNGTAWAGFEYPMNGLLSVPPLIQKRFIANIQSDNVIRGQFEHYMNIDQNNRTPFVQYNDMLQGAVDEMRNIIKQYRIFEVKARTPEQIKAAYALKAKRLYTRRRRPRSSSRTAKDSGRKRSRSSRRRRKRRRRPRSVGEKTLTKILKSTRRAVKYATEYYTRIEAPITFYIKTAVDKNYELDHD